MKTVIVSEAHEASYVFWIDDRVENEDQAGFAGSLVVRPVTEPELGARPSCRAAGWATRLDSEHLRRVVFGDRERVLRACASIGTDEPR